MNSSRLGNALSDCTTVNGPVGCARLVIADDHAEILDAAVRLLQPHFEIIATVSDGDAALDAAITLQPDVVVLDISMPFLNGIEVTRRLMATGSKVKIVFLTVMEDPELVCAALAAGGSAYVVKSRMATDLREAINEVLRGQTFISPPLKLN
jgi:DNA-binding NarL/FixJ family response regulator